MQKIPITSLLNSLNNTYNWKKTSHNELRHKENDIIIHNSSEFGVRIYVVGLNLFDYCTFSDGLKIKKAVKNLFRSFSSIPSPNEQKMLQALDGCDTICNHKYIIDQDATYCIQCGKNKNDK